MVFCVVGGWLSDGKGSGFSAFASGGTGGKAGGGNPLLFAHLGSPGVASGGTAGFEITQDSIGERGGRRGRGGRGIGRKDRVVFHASGAG